MEAAANGVISGIFAATGQTYMTGSRLIVQEGLYDELVERLAEKANSIKLGDPLDEETEMGPIANVSTPCALAQPEGAKFLAANARSGRSMINAIGREISELVDGYGRAVQFAGRSPSDRICDGEHRR